MTITESAKKQGSAIPPIGLANRVRRMLKRVPTAVKLVRDLRYLSMIMRERWLIDRLKMNDNSHLTKEWNFLTPAEQERYNVVIELVRSHIGSNDWGDVLEIGCAEGLFT